MSQSTPSANGIIPSQTARIEVIGVGGGGSNAVNRMIAAEMQGIGFWVLNTDAQALLQSAAPQRIQLGQALTSGLGAGGNPLIGQKAADLVLELLLLGRKFEFHVASPVEAGPPVRRHPDRCWRTTGLPLQPNVDERHTEQH
jgi:hypothetical protein